jgi:hypothetical protein
MIDGRVDTAAVIEFCQSLARAARPAAEQSAGRAGCNW